MGRSVSVLAVGLLISAVYGCSKKESASSSSPAQSSASRDDEPSSLAESHVERLARGRNLIEDHCVSCHSPARGYRPEVKDMARFSPEELHRSIRVRGGGRRRIKECPMPAWSQFEIADDDETLIAEYLGSVGSADPPIVERIRQKVAANDPTTWKSQEIEQLSSLEGLNLSGCAVTSAGLKTLTELKSLQTLDLSRTAITDKSLKELKNLKDLRLLDLSGTTVSAVGLQELKELKKLRTLCFRTTYNGVEPSGIGVTDDILRSLRDIGLLHVLAQAKARNGKRPSAAADVVEIDFWRSNITDAGLQELKAFENLQTLKYSPRRGASFKELRELKNLRTLGLRKWWVTDENLNELKEVKNLKTIYLHGAYKMTSSATVPGERYVREALPDVQIIRLE
jgi:mono/diheme cytochrome c family protein